MSPEAPPWYPWRVMSHPDVEDSDETGYRVMSANTVPSNANEKSFMIQGEKVLESIHSSIPVALYLEAISH